LQEISKKDFFCAMLFQMTKEKKTPTSFRLPPEIRDRMNRLIEKSSMPLSVIALAALRAGLTEIETGRFNPFTDAPPKNKRNQTKDQPKKTMAA